VSSSKERGKTNLSFSCRLQRQEARIAAGGVLEMSNTPMSCSRLHDAWSGGTSLIVIGE
jgi:hypothetical protein